MEHWEIMSLHIFYYVEGLLHRKYSAKETSIFCSNLTLSTHSRDLVSRMNILMSKEVSKITLDLRTLYRYP